MSSDDSSTGGESPIMIQEAETTQPSPPMEQADSPHSPDSTSVEPSSSESASHPRPSNLAQSNPNLVNMLSSTEPVPNVMVSIDRVPSSSTSAQVPDSPSRRKRDGEMPPPQPFSPTKKLKSPDKSDRK